MGYISDLSGEICINEDLKFEDHRKLMKAKVAKTLDGQVPGDYDVYVDYEQAFEDAKDYTIVRFVAAEIRPYYSSMKAYTIMEDVQRIVDLLGPGYTYSGAIEVDGEESGDLWRIYVRNGKAEAVRPQIVWPDE
jgi:enoyl reductase-like protein